MKNGIRPIYLPKALYIYVPIKMGWEKQLNLTEYRGKTIYGEIYSTKQKFVYFPVCDVMDTIAWQSNKYGECKTHLNANPLYMWVNMEVDIGEVV